MQNVVSIKSALPKYVGNATVLVDQHDVDDIIDGLQQYTAIDAPQYDKISEKFWTGDSKSTAKGLFDFLKKNVKYKVEPDVKQTVRSPQAILSIGTGDCKHYASFINGVMASLKRKGYPVGDCYYRYAGYNPLTGDLHHVFAVIKDGKKETWVDPVLPSFDQRKQYFVNEDKSANMPLTRLSGPFVGNIFDDIGKGIKNTVKSVEHGVSVDAQNLAKGAAQTVQKVSHGVQVDAQNVAKGIKNTATRATALVKQQVKALTTNEQNLAKGIKITAKKVSNTVKKDANALATGVKNTANAVKKVVMKLDPLTVAGRNAFLALLKVNAFNMAHRLYDYIHTSSTNKSEVNDKWSSAGGDPNKLSTAITQGMAAYGYRTGQQLADYNKKNNLINGVGYATVPPHMLAYYKKKSYEFPYYIAGLSDSGYKKGLGFDPATITALMAAASVVIALFAAIFKKAKWSAADQASATAAVATGAQTLSDAAAAVDGDGSFQTGFVTMPDGNTVATLTGDVTTDPDTGTTAVSVDPTSALDDDYEYQGDDDPNVVTAVDATAADADSLVAPDDGTSFTDSITNFFTEAENFVTANKTPLLITGGVLIALKLGVFGNQPKRRRR